MRKTKIVCTIGPASESIETLKALMEAGMNVARLNFSHGSHEEHGERITTIRQAASELGRNVAILLDTKGPEIRTGVLEKPSVELVEGQTIVLTTEEIKGNEKRVSVTYEGLPQDVHPGCTILIDDGLIGLTVEKIEGKDIHCHIRNGGTLKDRKGVNVPGVQIGLPGITEKDAKDIEFGIEQGIDIIAASFVRKAEDVLEIREILERHNADIHIISKIENHEGVNNAADILAVSDGLMVARGDLGVEIPAEEVPLVQKELIRRCNEVGKPVITATQMLDSMQRNPRPTRAEASDVANAIFDGTDAIMLSGETAAGKYPVEAVETMKRIAERTETALAYREILHTNSVAKQTVIPDALSQAVANVAFDLDAQAIITATESGHTARIVSKFRPKAPIIAVTPNLHVCRKLALVWGVIPLHSEPTESTDEMLDSSVRTAVRSGIVKRGDLVVITAGVPVREPGTTNLLKVHIVGDVVARGQGIGHSTATGKVLIAKDGTETPPVEGTNFIVVAKATDREMMPLIQKASALVIEEGGLTSHAAVVGLNLGIPVIVGVANAVQLFANGDEVTVDSSSGCIYAGFARIL
ncbi:pyruvate kinase [Aneurinibacillus migulanus]|uniref:pyruvate kinase n=1 Tax=Aneurinibacillus migulanus TaxID=47500 RepID=UPI0005BDE194|nr:pyruvate kinase [Aneurinibacillus migulanus]KIV50909.1 pyruvate kinase [Aneurinibacillus migulanus]KPD09651.1 pyruvate kinase [Aneurinibacillus migulanus]MCP1354954.1 pyruvate kinase [Aneurinibacillus migulanus]CEH31674.1 Pyruvate kinase [Aneurinibacillus migulanus]